MIVYVSYSLQDSELYLITLLFAKLRQAGHIVESPNSYTNSGYASGSQWSGKRYVGGEYYQSQSRVGSCDLFIGIITVNGSSNYQVMSEWKIANSSNVHNVLLVESGVNVPDPAVNHIVFDRRNPETAINRLFGIEKKQPENKTNPWVAAGLVVAGVAALIALLSGSGSDDD